MSTPLSSSSVSKSKITTIINTASNTTTNNMILRIRTQIGTWRVNNLSQNDTFNTIRSKLEEENKINLINIPFTVDPSGKEIYNNNLTIKQAKLSNGSMIYMQLNEINGNLTVHKASTGLKRIEKDGTIVRQDTSSIFISNGFRPGMTKLIRHYHHYYHYQSNV